MFRIAATQSRAVVRLIRRRRQEMMTYLVVIYVAFLVFLVIIVAVQEVLVPSLPSSVPTPAGESNRLGVGVTFARFGSRQSAYMRLLPHCADSGGPDRLHRRPTRGEELSRRRTRCDAAGRRVRRVHLAVLAGRVDDGHQPRRVRRPDNGRISVSSEGGFIVVREFEEDGRVLGTSEYFFRVRTASYR